MTTKTIDGRLIIDVSHPWDRPGPIRQPDPHPEAIPSEDEIMAVLQDLYEYEMDILAPLITGYDMDDFFMEGKIRLANANI